MYINNCICVLIHFFCTILNLFTCIYVQANIDVFSNSKPQLLWKGHHIILCHIKCCMIRLTFNFATLSMSPTLAGTVSQSPNPLLPPFLLLSMFFSARRLWCLLCVLMSFVVDTSSASRSLCLPLVHTCWAEALGVQTRVGAAPYRHKPQQISRGHLWRGAKEALADVRHLWQHSCSNVLWHVCVRTFPLS